VKNREERAQTRSSQNEGPQTFETLNIKIEKLGLGLGSGFNYI